MMRSRIVEDPNLHGRTRVFADRREAGISLAALLAPLALSNPLVLAIPAGGVPVAAALVERLSASLDVAVVSKIVLPWNSEVGFGAVAFDGSYRINKELVAAIGLGDEEVERGVAATRAKVERRVTLFRGERALPELSGRPVVVVDDGLASGFTLMVAIDALRRAGADDLTVAVPTGCGVNMELFVGKVETLCCANIRNGMPYAVADAYRLWCDVTEIEALTLLKKTQAQLLGTEGEDPH